MNSADTEGGQEGCRERTAYREQAAYSRAMEITVVGTGRAALAPERATLHLTATFEEAGQAEALRRVSALVRDVQSDLAGLSEGDRAPVTRTVVWPIGTRSWRPWSEDGSVQPLRHEASCQVEAEFTGASGFAALAGFADRWGGIAGIALGAVTWSLTEEARVRVEADVLAQALEQARARASVLAQAAGCGAVQCVEVADPGLLSRRVDVSGYAAEGSYGAGLMHARLASADGGGGGGIEIMPQDVEITAAVHARFAASDPT